MPDMVARQADIDEWNGLNILPINESVFQCFNPGAQRAADRDDLQMAF